MKDLSGKRLLLLGGSIWKDAIKQFADENEVVLVATGNDTTAGIFEISQEGYRVNSTDIEGMKRLIKEKKIDGVYMGGSEPIIAAASLYLNELSMPCYCTKEQWDWLQDKSRFKELCIKHGLPVVPKYDVNKENIEIITDTIDFPVITKPTDGCGSNGFSVCQNKKEFIDGYEKAAMNSPTQSVICEKFVKNESVVVFYTFSNGKIYFSGLEDKFPVRYKKQGSYVGGLFVFESKLVTEFRDKFESEIQAMISSIGIKEGSAWIEVFHDGNKYYFNEVGFRYGGSVSVYPVDYFHGINQVAADIYFALTGESVIIGHTSLIPTSLPRKKKYCIYPIHIKSGTIKTIEGIKSIRSMEGVVLLSLTKHEGDFISDTGSFSQTLALVHFVCDDVKECRYMIDEICNKLTIIDTDGNNMINRMLDISKIEF